jgi:hypothetical protein
MAVRSRLGRLQAASLLMVCLPGAALTACGGHASADDGPVITRVANPDLPYPLASVNARLSLRAGCLMLGPSVVFWPSATSWDANTREVVFGGKSHGADRARVGSMFRGGSGAFDLADLADVVDKDGVAALGKCLDRTGTTRVMFAYPSTS